MIKEYDRVKTLVPKDGYPAGMIGVAVDIHEAMGGCEVEIWDETDYPMDVVAFAFDELVVIDPKDYGKEHSPFVD